MQYGLPRPRRPNELANVIRCMRAYLRWRKRFAKLMPGFFDYAAADRQAREEAARRKLQEEVDAAIAKVYGKTT